MVCAAVRQVCAPFAAVKEKAVRERSDRFPGFFVQNAGGCGALRALFLIDNHAPIYYNVLYGGIGAAVRLGAAEQRQQRSAEMDMQKNYDPKEFEDRLYKEWMEKGYFRAEADPAKIPFTIVIPPPNITGQLHLGHALDNTIIDALIRFKRMQGYAALYLPGCDHASIATEVKIVEQMKAEGLTKKDVGRDGFLERAWAWKEKYGGRIVEQMKKMGVSCDWSRLAFTMDENCSRAVREVFVNLYEKGLIYRGDRIINWYPSCKTALSDAEVEYSEEDSFFWHLKYPVKGSDESIVVATTRPETMLGDTAVAVNPKDKRYTHMVGKTLVLPLVGREIPVVADDYVDMEFGSGAVKITPAHDPNDFEVGLRHSLPVIRVMNDDGTMNEEAGAYCGMDRYAAREKIVEDLKACGALVNIEPHKHNVGHCYRCHSTVEPIVSKQWFVKMAPLAKPAIDAVARNKIKFTPERFAKIYFNWMEGIKDWCISRQLWWGHRIPVWYCDDCGEMTVSKTDPSECAHCHSKHIHQDEDVLDTWFSSALWPFSTLGYPDKTDDFNYFYPTDVLSCGYDIIFFWVARMIFSGIEHTGKVPFRDVLLHGIVRDEQGRKMSKSLGNGIDPLEVIGEYGADSLRFSLISGVGPGNDTRYSRTKVEAGRNFLNKVWNASRFVLMNCEGMKVPPLSEIRLSPADKWIVSRLESCIREVTLNMNKFELGIAAGTLYDFLWSDFCDWYIELSKNALYGGDEGKKAATLGVLCFVLDNALRLLHPFVPFITEEIWRNIPGNEGKSIMVAEFPRYNAKLAYKKEAKAFEPVMDIIKAVRNMKTSVNCPPSKKVKLYVSVPNRRVVQANAGSVLKLAGASEIAFVESGADVAEKTMSQVTETCTVYVPLGELVDPEKERARLSAELDRILGEIARADGKLQNRGFVEKAPRALVEQERAKLEKFIGMKEKVEAQLRELE